MFWEILSHDTMFTKLDIPPQKKMWHSSCKRNFMCQPTLRKRHQPLSLRTYPELELHGVVPFSIISKGRTGPTKPTSESSHRSSSSSSSASLFVVIVVIVSSSIIVIALIVIVVIIVITIITIIIFFFILHRENFENRQQEDKFAFHASFESCNDQSYSRPNVTQRCC